MRPCLTALGLVIALALTACGGGNDSASTTPAPVPQPQGTPQLEVGIGEQGLAMFTDSNYKALGIRTVRLVTAYDAVAVRFERDIVDQWLAGAAAAGAEPFITFGHSRVHPRKLPSVAEFRTAFRAFRTRYPAVKLYAPWNEINHKSQPTADAPERAADYYNVVRAECPDCTVLAGDVLDQPGMVRYVKRYRSRLQGTPKVWGLHNYSDTNRFRSTGLRALLATVTGDVWLTETGGVVQFGRNFPRDEQRAARAVSFALRQARTHKRVKRIYLYNWTGGKPADRFDAGLVGPDGKPRPAYARLKDGLKP